MKKQNKIKLSYILILFISIGFAYLSASLSINGTTKVLGNKWSIHFDNLQENSDSNVVATQIDLNAKKDQVNYDVVLEKPGDKYSFDVDIVNDGTIDAMVKTYTLTGIPLDQQDVIDYKVTYKDGEEFKEKDYFGHDSQDTIIVTLEYNKNISSEDLVQNDTSLSLSFSITYVQNDSNSIRRSLVQKLATQAVRDDSSSANVESAEGMNFGNPSSDTNGKGLYLFSSTADDDFPIYYYRGDVTDNNLVFANKCWKIVRTTETGGIKILYNGTVGENGECNNSSKDFVIKNVSFNEELNSPTDSGYMFGERYPNLSYTDISNQNEVYYYGNDVTWDSQTNQYTLVDTIESDNWADDYQTIGDAHHYTCFSNSKTCSTVYYIFCSRDSEKPYVQTLTNGEKIEDRLKNMFRASSEVVNQKESVLKQALDSWYEENITEEDEKYIEDTVWCNDRSIAVLGGWDKDSSNVSSYSLIFGPQQRYTDGEVKLTCDAIQDQFSVEKTNGNGSLNHPVGTLTLDEVVLAGKRSSSQNTTYLGNGSWLLMSPYHYGGGDSREIIYGPNGVYDHFTSASNNALPAISLKRGVKAVSGNGSIDSPYVIEQR